MFSMGPGICTTIKPFRQLHLLLEYPRHHLALGPLFKLFVCLVILSSMMIQSLHKRGHLTHPSLLRVILHDTFKVTIVNVLIPVEATEEFCSDEFIPEVGHEMHTTKDREPGVVSAPVVERATCLFPLQVRRQHVRTTPRGHMD